MHFWVFYYCVLTSIECDISDRGNAFSVFIKTEEYSQWLPCGQICWLFFRQSMYQEKKVVLSCKIFCCCLAHLGCTQAKCICTEWICNLHQAYLTVNTWWLCFFLLDLRTFAKSATSKDMQEFWIPFIIKSNAAIYCYHFCTESISANKGFCATIWVSAGWHGVKLMMQCLRHANRSAVKGQAWNPSYWSFKLKNWLFLKRGFVWLLLMLCTAC